MRHLFFTLLLILSCTVTLAQGNRFTVCSLNVDGLPKNILGFSVNPEGPGSEGTLKISSYLAGKGYDLIAVSEDFNYNGSLLQHMSGYNAGTWRGALDAGSFAAALTRGGKVDTDGLNLIWKSQHQATEERWTSWLKTYGNLDHGFDENVDKGYRYYKITLQDGTIIDLYILHMDAEIDEGDIAAREIQLTQLAEEVIANQNGRPKIIMGDTNCRYTRDRVKQLLIDAIGSRTSYTVKDAWIEYRRSGNYPAYYSEDAGAHALTDTSDGLDGPNNEIVDKIFFLNPPQGLQISLKRMWIENDYTDENGQVLGDHYPLCAEFETIGTQLLPTDKKAFWKGEPETDSGTQRYLYNVGSGYYLNETGTLVSSPASASLWGIWGDGDQRTLSTDGGYRLVLGYSLFSYYCKTQTSSGATSFSLETGWSRPDAFKLKASKHYVNVKWNDNYTLDAGSSYDTDLSDWLFISPGQLATYDAYVAAWNRAQLLIDYPMPDTIRRQLTQALHATVTYTDAPEAIQNFQLIEAALWQYVASLPDTTDYTNRIANPSFEKKSLIASLDAQTSSTNHIVYGWNVPRSAEAEEAFAAWENPLNENGRYFTGMDGTHLFNTWSPGGTGNFYCTQEVNILKEGYYELSAIVASGGQPEGDTRVNLILGPTVQPSPILTDRSVGVRLKAYAYFTKGKQTIGIKADNWFKADNFRLLLRKPHIEAPGDITCDEKVNLADLKMLLRIYLGTASPSPYADINLDGRISIADVSSLINILK